MAGIAEEIAKLENSESFKPLITKAKEKIDKFRKKGNTNASASNELNISEYEKTSDGSISIHSPFVEIKLQNGQTTYITSFQ